VNWVAEGIAVGGYADTLDHAALQAVGIEAVLQFHGRDPCPDGFRFAGAYLQLPVEDARRLPPEWLRQGVDFITEQRGLGRNVLVACSAGLSRSPTFVAAYLHEQGMDLAEAYLMIQAGRRSIMPHPELLRSLVSYYGLSTSAEELLVALVKARSQMRSG
jgi:hypothetical protein